VARFFSLDPKADKFHLISPYVYVANNPISLVDIDGRDIVNAYASKPNSESYKTVQRNIEMLKKSNPELYGYLNDNPSVRVIVNLKSNLQTKNGQKLDRVNSANRKQTTSKKELTAKARMSNADGIVMTGSQYFLTEQLSSITIDKTTREISGKEAEEFYNEYFYVNEFEITLEENLSKEEQAKKMAHEAGHVAFVLDNPFTSYVWNLIGDKVNRGHDPNNPSGQRALAEETTASDYISNLTLEDWEKIADSINKKMRMKNRIKITFVFTLLLFIADSITAQDIDRVLDLTERNILIYRIINNEDLKNLYNDDLIFSENIPNLLNLLPEKGYSLDLDYYIFSDKFPLDNCILYTIIRDGFNITNGEIKTLYGSGYSYDKPCSNKYLVAYNEKDDFIIFLSGCFIVSKYSGLFKLNFDNPETFYEFLSYRLYSYRPEKIVFEKKRKGNLIFSFYSKKEKFLVQINKNNFDEIEVFK